MPKQISETTPLTYYYNIRIKRQKVDGQIDIITLYKRVSTDAIPVYAAAVAVLVIESDG